MKNHQRVSVTALLLGLILGGLAGIVFLETSTQGQEDLPCLDEPTIFDEGGGGTCVVEDPYWDPPSACTHHGLPIAGWLELGQPLPFGFGYYNTHSHTFHSYGCPNGMLGTIQSVGSGWVRVPNMGVLDISQLSGGLFPPHSRHQNGLDVDIRYVRNDFLEIPLDLSLEPYRYDWAGTQTLIDLFCIHGGTKIRTVSEANLIKPGGCSLALDNEPTLSDKQHKNHFHVDRWDPDGIFN